MNLILELDTCICFRQFECSESISECIENGFGWLDDWIIGLLDF
ncbi:hypothetical protein [Allomuricauda sp. NBRC 101325]|nr:hypothetical protein [Muricauda sp. NBRC 101325]